MKKSIIAFISLALVITIMGVTLSRKGEKVTYNKSQAFDATYVIPSDLEALENSSEVIVKGSFTGSRETDKDDSLIGPSTVSQFKVDEIYKGNVDKDTISVLEPYEIVKNDFINIEGYIPMEDGKDYLLFLRENNTEYGKQYSIISISFGKYNLSNTKTVQTYQKSIEYLDEVLESDFVTNSQVECDKYNNIKEEIISKYNN